MDQCLEHARRCLEANGFRTERIDEADEERADLRVSDCASSYLIEVKGKEVSEAYRELCSGADRGNSAELARSVGYSNRLDKIVRKAHSQLESTPSPVGAFRVLWISCLMGDIAFIHDQFEHTLYGIQQLGIYDPKGEALPSILPCFYYHYSSFYRFREIDAVILSGPESGRLCVNEFSPRSRAFRQAHMYTLFPQEAVVDPLALEESGRALALRVEIERTDAKAKWSYIRNAFGYMTAPAQPYHFTGMNSVPLDKK